MYRIDDKAAAIQEIQKYLFTTGSMKRIEPPFARLSHSSYDFGIMIKSFKSSYVKPQTSEETLPFTVSFPSKQSRI